MISIPSARPVATRSRMAEQIVFTTTKSSGTWGGSGGTATIYTTSPRLTVEWGGTGWTGGTATQTYTTTSAGGGEYYATISRGCSSAGTKTITVYPTDSSGNRIGEITRIILSGDLPATNPSVISITDLKNCRNLIYISVTSPYSSGISNSLDFSGLKSLQGVYFNNNASTTSVDVTGCSALKTLASSGSFSAITGLSSTQSTLEQLQILSNTGITSLDVSNFSSLRGVNLYGCSSLTSLRAQNVMLYALTPSYYGNYMYFQDGGAQLEGTALGASALNQFFTDLATNTSGESGLIGIVNTPGVNTCDITIATNKGYTVIGMLPP